jgi:GDP-D-mannose 3',5'-epimerase
MNIVKIVESNMKNALVLGAGGFIGSHMVKRLKSEGYWVRGVDLKYPEFSKTEADHFVIRDLRNARDVSELISYAGCNRNPYEIFARQFDKQFDEIYQFAADMGGAGYIFTKEHDADIMHNSATINLNVLSAVVSHMDTNRPRIFYSSSACMYPEHNQLDPNNPNCEESSAYPANPDSEYGWEKLFSERLYLAYERNYNLEVRVARYHNIYGPEGTWRGGKEKAPAAICRKVAEAKDEIEVWGDGEQTRSFLYIDECIEATRRLMQSDFSGPVNIGSDEMVTINQLVKLAQEASGKTVNVKHIDGPLGVRGRNSDNKLIAEKLGWAPNYSLKTGIKNTYEWIEKQINEN